MHQIAVFVDAGYLLAQGSALLAGQKQPRNLIVIDVELVLKALRQLCRECDPKARLLRIYWYDGLLRTGRLSSEQEQIAGAPYTKLRLGVVNSKGEQKGVDSLIVTDLIDLARSKSIANAVVLSGDEDIRIGAQIAQTFGVQIHLLGVKPARGSQSPDLIQEADTHHEWSDQVVGSFMSLRTTNPAEQSIISSLNDLTTESKDVEPSKFADYVKTAMDDTIDTVEQLILDQSLKAFKTNSSSVPPELDRPTLGRLRSLIQRDLSEDERKSYRIQFKEYLSRL